MHLTSIEAITWPLVLAQSGQVIGDAVQRILIWTAVLMAAVLFAVIVGLILRRILRGSEEPTVDTGFTLASLRQMRDEGSLSEQEYEAAKLAMLARSRAQFDQTDTSAPLPSEQNQADDEPADDDEPPSDKPA